MSLPCLWTAPRPKSVDNNTVVVVVDTNKPSYTECQDLLYLTRTIVVLDHHRRGSEVIQNAVLSYVEPYASSTCEMVAEILQYFSDDLRLRSLEADCLYAGMVIDTNNFTTRSGVRTFEAAAFLRRNGADITRVRKMPVITLMPIRQEQRLYGLLRSTGTALQSADVQVKAWRALP